MSGVSTITVRHNFESGHRLPHLGGKCTNLHGHSWWAEISLAGLRHPTAGTVAEFGAVKATLRDWIDKHLDHGLMLGTGDPLAEVLAGYGKVYRFGAEGPGRAPAEAYARGLHWPTVENVAVLLGRVAEDLLIGQGLGNQVVCVRIQETHVNAAEWRP